MTAADDQDGQTGQRPGDPRDASDRPYFQGPPQLPPPAWGTFGPGGPASGGNTGAPGSRPGRRVEVSTATSLLSAVPWFFWSFVVISSVAGTFGPSGRWIGVGLWLLSGAVVFLHSVEETIARFMFRLRKPTLVEQQRIYPIWREVARRADVDGAKFSLWIQNSDEVSAHATPGHTVALTRWALYTLPPSHLEAVLAHELSHHLGGRTWLSLLNFWYSIPARSALVVVRLMVRAMKAVPAIGCLVGGFLALSYLGILLAIITFGGSFVFPIFFLTPFIAPPILAWLSRWEEKQADRRAAALGYGPALVQVFYGWQVKHQNSLGRESSRSSQLMSSHPSMSDRVHAIEGIQQP
jgi:Zn-dependent protease with chaperone function